MTDWREPGSAFEDLFGRFLAENENTLRGDTPGTWLVYGRHFSAHFVTIGECTDARTAQYARARLAVVRRETVKKEHSVLRRFYSWCVEQEYVDCSPVIPPLPKKAAGRAYEKRRRVTAPDISVEEARALIDLLPEWSREIKGKRHPIRARFMVGFEASLRPSTLDKLSVPEHYTPGSTVLRITKDIDKEMLERDQPLTPSACAALEAVCPKQGLIFGSHDYSNELRKAAAKTLPPHKAAVFTGAHLRSARITQVAEANIVGAQWLAGHKMVSTTARYVKANARAAARALDAVGPTGFRAGLNPASARRGPASARKPATVQQLCEGEDLNLHGSYPASTSS